MDTRLDLVQALGRICGDGQVLHTKTQLVPYLTRGPEQQVSTPLVVLPGNAGEVLAVVRLCLDRGVSFKPRGAGNGPPARAGAQVLVALTRLRLLLELDRPSARAQVQAGAACATLARAWGPAVPALTRQLASAPSATVGGMLAAGTGRELLRSVELVSPAGELVQLSADACTYDLCGDFVGSRGTRGIAVSFELDLSMRLAFA